MFLQNHTYKELRTRVLKLLERYSSNGIQNTCGEVCDIEGRLVESANTHLRKLYAEFLKPLQKVQLKIKMLDFQSCEKNCTITPETTLTFESTGMGTVFYCKATGDLTVTVVSESGNSSYRIYDDTGETQVICGCAKSCYDSNTIISIETTTSAQIIEFYIFSGADYIQGEEIEVTPDGIILAKIPEDCAEIIAIYDNFGRKVSPDVVERSNYSGRLYVDESTCGDFIVEYLALPQGIPDDATGEEIIKLPSILFDALCYMCASDVCPANDGNVFSKLTYKYREILENYYCRNRSFESGRNSFFALTGRIKK